MLNYPEKTQSLRLRYQKKQTLVTSERFTFAELEDIERTILEADEIIQTIEKDEFEK